MRESHASTVIMFLPSILVLPFSEEFFHFWMVVFVLPVSVYALTMGCKKTQVFQSFRCRPGWLGDSGFNGGIRGRFIRRISGKTVNLIGGDSHCYRPLLEF